MLIPRNPNPTTQTKGSIVLIGHGYEHLTLTQCLKAMTWSQRAVLESRKGKPGWTGTEILRRAQGYVDENQSRLRDTDDPEINGQALKDQLNFERAYEIAQVSPELIETHGQPGDWDSQTIETILEATEETHDYCPECKGWQPHEDMPTPTRDNPYESTWVCLTCEKKAQAEDEALQEAWLDETIRLEEQGVGDAAETAWEKVNGF